MGADGIVPDTLGGRPAASTLLAAPLRPRTYGTLAYLALAFPLGLAYFVATVVGLSLSLGLAVLVVGLPLFVLVLGSFMLVAVVERRLATYLLGADIGSPRWKVTESTGVAGRLVALVTDTAVWAAGVFAVSKFVVGVAAFVLLVTLFSTSFSLLSAPVYYDRSGVTVGLIVPEPITRELSLLIPWNDFVVGVSFVVEISSWEVTTLPGALAMSLIGAVLLVASLNVFNAAGWLCARWAELLLDPSRLPGGTE